MPDPCNHDLFADPGRYTLRAWRMLVTALLVSNLAISWQLLRFVQALTEPFGGY